jgi:hypothetical protein
MAAKSSDSMLSQKKSQYRKADSLLPQALLKFQAATQLATGARARGS